jgi:hypothetical protein
VKELPRKIIPRDEIMNIMGSIMVELFFGCNFEAKMFDS